MKLVVTRGCVCDAVEIDGENEMDLTDEQRQEVLDRIFKKLKPSDLNQLLWKIVEIYGEYEDLGECEECGDTICSYTWEI
jgi:hypothetical protein